MLKGLRAEALNRQAPQTDWDARLGMRHGELALERQDRARTIDLLSRAITRFDETDTEAAEALRARMDRAGLPGVPRPPPGSSALSTR